MGVVLYTILEVNSERIFSYLMIGEISYKFIMLDEKTRFDTFFTLT